MQAIRSTQTGVSDQSAGILGAMRWLYRAFHGYNLGLAALCLALFLAALVSGQGLMSFAFLFAAVWWAALGTYWSRRSRKARRIAELRGKRLRRERLRRDRALELQEDRQESGEPR